MVLKTHGIASERVISVLAPPGSATLTVTPVPSSLGSVDPWKVKPSRNPAAHALSPTIV